MGVCDTAHALMEMHLEYAPAIGGSGKRMWEDHRKVVNVMDSSIMHKASKPAIAQKNGHNLEMK
jgi:hypothetical protein